MSQSQSDDLRATRCRAASRLGGPLTAAVALMLFSAGMGPGQTVRADETTNTAPASTARTFAAWVQNGELVGDEQVRRLFMASGATQWGLIVPSELRVDLAKADRVTLIGPGMSYFMTMRISGALDGSQAARERALREYPGAAVMEESSTETLGKRYVMLKLRWKSAPSVDRIVWVTYVPTAAGTLDCSMVAEQARAAEAEDSFVGALQRMQSGERGKFQMQEVRSLGYN